jgi:tRNA (cytidine/uridine-2'-O-)-methyltransferase
MSDNAATTKRQEPRLDMMATPSDGQRAAGERAGRSLLIPIRLVAFGKRNLSENDRGHRKMVQIALWEPEIPPNAGNIARLCAATATPLHLIGRLGFRLDDRHLRRAGLDYWSAVQIHRHATLEQFESSMASARLFCLSAHTTHRYTEVRYQCDDVLLFGGESKGLPDTFRARHADRLLTIPMPGAAVRSLNLATAVGIVLYEALRQIEGW